MLVPKIKHLDGSEGLTDLSFWPGEPLGLVNEPLESVEIPLILREECSRVAPFLVQWRHWDPFVIKNVKFFTFFHHLILFVATAHNVDVPVLELIVGREGGSWLGNGLQVLNLVCQKMILEDIVDWSWWITVIYTSRNYDYSVIWDVDSPSVFQRLVQFVTFLVIGVLRNCKVPFWVCLGILAVGQNILNVLIH